MKTIASFTIDHLRLLPGLYVSRKDRIGDETITTFDIRMTSPNREPTFLRNHPLYSSQIIYFGPMGCRTGFYLVMGGDLSSTTVWPLVKEMFEFISTFSGEIPGAKPEQCGNYLDQNLEMAKYLAKRYLAQMSENPPEERLNYPV